MGPSEASLFRFRKDLSFWEEAPGRAARLTLRKVPLLFNAHEVGDNYVYGSFRSRVGLLRWSAAVALIRPEPEEASYLVEGRHREAREVFEEVLRVDTDSRLAEYWMGLLHKYAGRFDRSRFHFERFLENEPPESHWASRARANLEEFER